MNRKELSNIAKALGSNGGKKSVMTRLKGKTPEEISQIMREVRLRKKIDAMENSLVTNLNQNVMADQTSDTTVAK